MCQTLQTQVAALPVENWHCHTVPVVFKPPPLFHLVYSHFSSPSRLLSFFSHNNPSFIRLLSQNSAVSDSFFIYASKSFDHILKTTMRTCRDIYLSRFHCTLIRKHQHLFDTLSPHSRAGFLSLLKPSVTFFGFPVFFCYLICDYKWNLLHCIF